MSSQNTAKKLRVKRYLSEYGDGSQSPVPSSQSLFEDRIRLMRKPESSRNLATECADSTDRDASASSARSVALFHLNPHSSNPASCKLRTAYFFLNTRPGAWSVNFPSRRTGHAVHQHVADALRQLLRLFVRGHVANGRRIEDDDVGEGAGTNGAAVGETEH